MEKQKGKSDNVKRLVQGHPSTMNILRFLMLLIMSMFISTHSTSQPADFNKIIGKKFVSRTMEYLEIINDTSVYSSLNAYKDTATFSFRHDTMLIKQEYVMLDGNGYTHRVEYLDYKLVSLNPDTLRLKNNFRYLDKPDNWEDTLEFINVEKLKEPVNDFKLIKLDYYNVWCCEIHVTVDSLGRMSFFEKLDSMPGINESRKSKPRYFKRRLTNEEFADFKDRLSRSLPSKLTGNRRCPMDAVIANFDIWIGRKKVESTGCDLYWPHAFLLNYLLGLTK